LLGFATAVVAASTWVVAQDAGGREVKRSRVSRTAVAPPQDHSTAVDGPPVFAFAGGWVYSAWAYRSDGEFSIAISHRDAVSDWSAPTFIGLGDGQDQTSPALAADEFGNLYLAYVVEQTGQVWMTARWTPFPGAPWFQPQQIDIGQDRAATPALAIVNWRVVLGFDSTTSGVRLFDWKVLPASPTGFQIDGIQDGPDGFPITGLTSPGPSNGGEVSVDHDDDNGGSGTGTTDPKTGSPRARSNGRRS
jgi:hypothetical protein